MEQNHPEEIDKLPETKGKSIRWAWIARMVVITVITLVLACVVLRWLCGVIIPGVTARREEKQELSPLIKEAKSLKLTYESVLKYPDKALGKHAIWCIQNRGPGQVFYEGKQDKRIFVSNKGSMPLYLGGKHSICALQRRTYICRRPNSSKAAFFETLIDKTTDVDAATKMAIMIII